MNCAESAVKNGRVNMRKCAKCGQECSNFAVINTQINSKGDTVKLCLKHHQEWADLENTFTKRKDEAIKQWLEEK